MNCFVVPHEPVDVHHMTSDAVFAAQRYYVDSLMNFIFDGQDLVEQHRREAEWKDACKLR